jgi:excinuclease UvrABC nuclease subunit
MKNCNKCNVELVVGKNIFDSRAKNYDWVCKECVSNGIKKHHHKRNIRLKTEEGAGVYAIYKDNQIVYIGESKSPTYRVNTHFTSTWKKNSSLSNIIGKHNKHHFRWEMLVYEDCEVERKLLESFYIDRYKPALNYPYNMLYI